MVNITRLLVGEYQLVLLLLKLADITTHSALSLWVVAIPHRPLSGLLTVSVLGSLESKWLVWLAGYFKPADKGLFLALQRVSSKCLTKLKPVDDTCSWLFREWVADMPCYASSLLTTPVLGSSGWVASMPYYVSSSLTIPVLGSSVGQWLLCFTVL